MEDKILRNNRVGVRADVYLEFISGLVMVWVGTFMTLLSGSGGRNREGKRAT